MVYILKSTTTDKYYIGYTSNLEKRVKYHNTRRNKSTKHGAPWSLVYFESFDNRIDAWKREYQIKSYKSGEAFKKLIK
ncbi:MAG: GIY-YIG nuclease family protein [bacterium]|nr:GIY-YIG nuclease family protein [bacterium]